MKLDDDMDFRFERISQSGASMNVTWGVVQSNFQMGTGVADAVWADDSAVAHSIDASVGPPNRVSLLPQSSLLQAVGLLKTTHHTVSGRDHQRRRS